MRIGRWASFVLACLGVVLLAAVPAAAGTRSASGGGVTVTMTGPSTCTRDGTIEIAIRLDSEHGGGGSYGFTYDVTLREDDVFVDDTIGRQTVVGPVETGPWSETVTFRFEPRKHEVGRSLELYFVVKRKVSGLPGLLTITNRGNPLRITCR